MSKLLNVSAVRTYRTVYHYCPPSAFCSIIQDKQLWLSDACCLNDYEEHKRGLEMARGLLNQAGRDRPQIVAKACKGMTEWIDGNKINPYVCCFSRNPNSLPQWIAYAKRATGYAIGFDCAKLKDLLISKVGDRRARAGEVEYDHGIHFDRISRAVNEYLLDAVEVITQFGYPNFTFWHVANEHFDKLWEIAVLIKSNDFAWEQEWRLVAMPVIPYSDLTEPPFDPDTPATMPGFTLEERSTDGRKIPYFRLPFTADCVSEVHLGSKCSPDASAEAINLLKRNNIDAEVHPSPISYR